MWIKILVERGLVKELPNGVYVWTERGADYINNLVGGALQCNPSYTGPQKWADEMLGALVDSKDMTELFGGVNSWAEPAPDLLKHIFREK